MMNFSDYMLVQEAADFLGVSPTTLRNWEGSKKIKSFRHPVNKYRLYKKEDLEQILKEIECSKK